MPAIQETPVLAVETIQDFQHRLDTLLSQPDYAHKDILLSTDFDLAPLAELSGLNRTPIPWPIDSLNMFYVLQAPPETHVPFHSHPSDVFRFILEGEMTLNGITVKAGMWCVVRKGTRYTVSSNDGYRSLVAYRDICEVTGRNAQA